MRCGMILWPTAAQLGVCLKTCFSGPLELIQPLLYEEYGQMAWSSKSPFAVRRCALIGLHWLHTLLSWGYRSLLQKSNTKKNSVNWDFNISGRKYIESIRNLLYQIFRFFTWRHFWTIILGKTRAKQCIDRHIIIVGNLFGRLGEKEHTHFLSSLAGVQFRAGFILVS